MVYQIRKFTESWNFANAIKVTLAAVLPVLVFSYFDLFHLGFTVAIGALLVFPSDTSSNLRHKIKGLIVTGFIVSGSAFIISLVYPYPIAFYPVFTFIIFLLSLISVYGHRATLVSFSGLLSASLVFSNIYSGMELLQHCGLMLFGSLFYLIVSVTFYLLRPNRYIELQISECMRLTAKYLKLRGDLWSVEANRTKIIEKQLHLQVEINTIHENIRETLIGNRLGSGHSNRNQKMLIVFISLLEILELALSTSFDHSKMQKKFSQHPKVLRTYQNLAYNLGRTLKKLSTHVERGSKYQSKHKLFDDLHDFERAIEQYEQNLDKDIASEGVYMLTTMLHYAAKQVERINLVERAFTVATFKYDLKGREKDLGKFLKPQYYPLSMLKENFTFSSSIFRHSLRLTVTILFGFILGQFLPFQNVYWILLTIVVIMRPGYGLTKERSYQRIFGTVLGGLIAFGILSVVQNPVLVSSMAIVAMVLGYSFSQSNYKVGATFVTMYVVFIYGMITPNLQDVVQYRILDTCVGALLAFAANHFLWPSWEFLSVPAYIEKAIKANRDYLKEISLLYNKKGEVPVTYRLARKEAFIEVGNLMASFQRMVQEPKSKQKQLPQLYKLAVVNHTLLSASASLGTYIQSHQTTKASEAFNAVVDTAIRNLDDAVLTLTGHDVEIHAHEDLSLRFNELKNIRATEIATAEADDAESFRARMQEAQLVIEQLIALTSLTENILRTIPKFKSTY